MNTEKGFTSPEVAAAAGITYRQLDYWSGKGWVRSSIKAADGYGSVRRHSLEDAVMIAAVAHLSRAGVAIESAVSIATQPPAPDGLIRHESGPVTIFVDVIRTRAEIIAALDGATT